ncbi:RibD family protein [Oceanicella actignis]|uniref:Riboflavin-specific deaminase C-terminal domain-containing protein n=1 Tax=Oceanicella actignis TaxID=1189325 RepID=A0A1M7SEI5_9RHOB|nr:RibD family protein [Oceanicella actignis]SET23424.1 riboflavin-specific deaminase C-terminal domain-containing protein [Oceanicella actignis]SHN56880.1 riboflavin-specific deaminase C-terminal domain-containing protein [Oceanicella actignis]
MNHAPATRPQALAPLREDGAPVVIAQLGQSLDGRIATVTGASKYINGARALEHLHRLRAHVDAVIVGVGTVAADDPRLTVRRVDGRHPARVVIDPRGRMPRDAAILADGTAPVLVASAPDAPPPPPPAEALRLPAPGGRFDPRAIVAALAERGLTRLLVEGGADTLAGFLEARAVDMLHILMSPMILGSGKPGFRLSPIERLDEALRPRTEVHVFDDGDVLFTCDMRNSWSRP